MKVYIIYLFYFKIEYTNLLNQTTLMQRYTWHHVGQRSSRNQVLSQFTNIFSDDFQHCSVLCPFLIVKILVQIEKPDVDNVFQIVRYLVSRQNVIDPFVLVDVEDDPTFSPLSFDRVHFELVCNMERMIQDPSKKFIDIDIDINIPTQIDMDMTILY